MKTELALLILSAGISAAQGDPSVRITEFTPACAHPCFEDAVSKATPCSWDDSPCQCEVDNYRAIYDAAVICVLDSCGAAVGINEVIPGAAAFCEAAIGPAATQVPFPTESGTVAPTDAPTDGPSNTDPAPSNTDEPVPSGSDGPAPSGSDAPAPSGSDGPGPSGSDGPVPTSKPTDGGSKPTASGSQTPTTVRPSQTSAPPTFTGAANKLGAGITMLGGVLAVFAL